MKHSRSIALCLILMALAVGFAGTAIAGVNQWTSIGPEGGSVSAVAVDPVTPSTVYAGTSGGVYKSTDSGANWSNISLGAVPGRVADIVVDHVTHTTLYAGHAFLGVYKSIDAGVNWAPVNSGMTNTVMTGPIVMDPVTSSTLYVTTLGGIFRSADGGANWTILNTGISNFYGVSIAIDPATTTTLYTSSGSSIYKSMDGGTNWTAINNTIGGLITIDPAIPSTLYIGRGDGVYKSTDSGVNWTAANAGISNKTVMQLTIDPVTTTTLYATVSGYLFDTDIGVYKSTDGGASWAIMNTGMGNAFVRDLAIDPVDPSTLYVGTQFLPFMSYGSGALFKSTDGGANWIVMNKGLSARDIATIAFDPSVSSTVYTVADGEVYRSVDGGNNWVVGNNGLENLVASPLAIDPVTTTTLYVGGYSYGISNAGVYKSTDGGASWIAANTGISNKLVVAIAIDPVTTSTLYAGASYSMGESGVYKSTDGGGNWTVSRTGMGNATVREIVIDPVTTSTLYAGTYDAGMFKSTDSGGSWIAINTGLSNTTITALVVDPIDPSTLYAGTSGNFSNPMSSGDGIFKTTDSGASWALINTGLGNGDVNVIAIDPTDPTRLYAGLSHSPVTYREEIGVYMSSDSGASWSQMNEGIGNIPVYDFAIDPVTPTNLYAGTGGLSVVNYTHDEILGISVTPASMDFGNVQESKVSTLKEFTIENKGSVDLNVSSILISGGDWDNFNRNTNAGSNPCVTPAPVLAPGASCTGVVAFLPQSTGAKSSILYIYSDDLETPIVTIPLSGTGTSAPVPDIAVSPVSISFGSIQTGSSSVSNTVTIRNNGSATLDVSGMSLGGTNPGEFTLDVSGGASPCGSATPVLLSGTKCTVTVSFDPVSIGSKSATLDIDSDDPDTSVASVSLSGTGTPPPAPNIIVTPLTLDFGSHDEGTTSVANSVTVHNSGNLDLNVSNIALSGTDAGDFVLNLSGGSNPCGSAVPVIAPGGSCTVNIAFSPLTSGVKSATLDISSDDPDTGLVSVSLSGTGLVVTPPPPIGGGGGGCGIVRAYGDTDAPEVNALRGFRDRYLMPHATGRALVDLYYRVSPEVEGLISAHRSAQIAIRVILTPVVFWLLHPYGVLLCIMGCLGIIAFMRMRWQGTRVIEEASTASA